VLKQRVITALALVAALLAALAWSPLAFAGLLTLGFSLAQAEWLRLSGWSFRTALLVALTLGGAQFALFAAAPATVAAIVPAAVAIATAIWIGLGVVLLRSEKKGAVRIPAATSRALAIALPFAAWCALMMFLQLGAVMLLSVLVIIWLADIAAYFVGRAFGRSKLAPHISPGKTWAGVWGAIGGVVVAALIAWTGFPDAPLFTNRLLEGLGIPLAAVALSALVGVSIIGDLAESLLKRQANAKDSSHLLPGHGGFFDRLDSMFALLPAAALLWTWAK
jgi:phosphatidate cytidylyltransferase